MDWIISMIRGNPILIVNGIPLAIFIGGTAYMLFIRTAHPKDNKTVHLIDQFLSFDVWKRKEK